MTISTDPQYQKPNAQPLDVVMLKLSASEFTATPGDIKRVSVMAADPIEARGAPDVVKLGKEYRVLGVMPPGYQTEAEMMAQQREYAGNVTDRANIGLTGADHVPVLQPYADPNRK